MTSAKNEFVITHFFKNVSSMKEGVHYSPIEEHCRVPWKIGVVRTSDRLGLYLHCLQEKKHREWSIGIRQEGIIRTANGTTNGDSPLENFVFHEGFKTYSRNSDVIYKSTDKENGWGWQFISWEDMMKDYVIDDTLTVEIRVEIKNMIGIHLRNFDESTRQFSDVVLVVENQKFYVSKLYLASQSMFFEAMFLGDFEESKLSEIPLKEIEAEDFQKFLELLYGENPIDDDTVEGIADLANMYDSKIAIRKCQEFLMKDSEKSLIEKLHLAHHYNLLQLKDHCFSKLTTEAEILSALDEYQEEMDPTIVGLLLQRSESFCD